MLPLFEYKMSAMTKANWRNRFGAIWPDSPRHGLYANSLFLLCFCFFCFFVCLLFFFFCCCCCCFFFFVVFFFLFFVFFVFFLFFFVVFFCFFVVVFCLFVFSVFFFFLFFLLLLLFFLFCFKLESTLEKKWKYRIFASVSVQIILSVYKQGLQTF